MEGPALAQGELIAGKYRVERVLGSGGMGVVVAAWHCELGQPVAVKLVRPEALAQGDALKRFRREARAAAALRSPHVVRVMDVSISESGSPFMVMELLEGHDLERELAQRGPLPVGEAVHYVLQMIDALAEAHAAGIVHRDLKPANLFLARQPDGSRVLKVLDFGVSKTKSLEPSDLGLTQDYALIGSPLYMSPEQMRSARDVDLRTDIWSLGVILYELLTGHTPYSETSIVELFRAMLEPPPPLHSFRSDVPAALERVIARCLERYPARRFQNVSELARELVEFAGTSGVFAAPSHSIFVRTRPDSRDTELTATTHADRHASTSVGPLTPNLDEQLVRGKRISTRKLAIAGAGTLALGFLAFAFYGQSVTRDPIVPSAPHAAADGLSPLAPPPPAPPPPDSAGKPDPQTASAPGPAPPASAAEFAPVVAPSLHARTRGPKISKTGTVRVGIRAKPLTSVAPVNTAVQAIVPPVPDYGGRR